MAISDEKQRVMPMPEDLLQNRGKKLIVPESVLLVNPINPHLKGEVTIKECECVSLSMCSDFRLIKELGHLVCRLMISTSTPWTTRMEESMAG